MNNPPCYEPDCEKCSLRESCKNYKPVYIPYPYTSPTGTGDYWPIKYPNTVGDACID